jgi:hypothetical protein
MNIAYDFSINISICFSVRFTGLIPKSGASALILCLTSSRVSIMLLSSLWSIPEFNYEEGVDAYPPFIPTLPEAPVGVPEEPLF